MTFVMFFSLEYTKTEIKIIRLAHLIARIFMLDAFILLHFIKSPKLSSSSNFSLLKTFQM